MTKYSKSIIVDYEKFGAHCYITGIRTGLERHHCMNGTSQRAKAEKDGLWVWLTHDIHAKVHSTRPDWKYELKRVAQKAYEQNHSRAEWMSRYHKNYLEE